MAAFFYPSSPIATEDKSVEKKLVLSCIWNNVSASSDEVDLFQDSLIIRSSCGIPVNSNSDTGLQTLDARLFISVFGC
jgi:hypothetical protein